MKFLTLALYFTSISVSVAGNLSHCPDLATNESIANWNVIGHINKNLFSKILISITHVGGLNTVTCHYDQGVRLYKIGNVQTAGSTDLWQPINLGGISYYQCLASTQQCRFYEE
jgi:hypothetical protein